MEIDPPMFSGTEYENFSMWINEMQIYFNTFEVPEAYKHDIFVYSLSGDAFKHFKEFDPLSVNTYSKAVENMSKIYQKSFQSEDWLRLLQNTKYDGIEDYQRFSLKIQSLVQKAFPEIIDHNVIDKLSIEFFMQNIDSALATKVRSTNPPTLAACIEKINLYSVEDIDINSPQKSIESPNIEKIIKKINLTQKSKNKYRSNDQHTKISLSAKYLKQHEPSNAVKIKTGFLRNLIQPFENVFIWLSSTSLSQRKLIVGFSAAITIAIITGLAVGLGNNLKSIKQSDVVSIGGLNATCKNTSDCDTSLNLACDNFQCKCDQLTHFWDGFKCLPYLSYNNACNYSYECFGALVCQKTNQSCNCPINISLNKCDCPSPSTTAEYYWNGSMCVKAGSYGSTCVSGLNYTCMFNTQKTSCSTNSKCECINQNGAFINGTCKYCPIGWKMFANSCYKVINSPQKLTDTCLNSYLAEIFNTSLELYIASIVTPLNTYWISFIRNENNDFYSKKYSYVLYANDSRLCSNSSNGSYAYFIATSSNTYCYGTSNATSSRMSICQIDPS